MAAAVPRSSAAARRGAVPPAMGERRALQEAAGPERVRPGRAGPGGERGRGGRGLREGAAAAAQPCPAGPRGLTHRRAGLPGGGPRAPGICCFGQPWKRHGPCPAGQPRERSQHLRGMRASERRPRLLGTGSGQRRPCRPGASGLAELRLPKPGGWSSSPLPRAAMEAGVGMGDVPGFSGPVDQESLSREASELRSAVPPV